jgi:hypothetical protein
MQRHDSNKSEDEHLKIIENMKHNIQTMSVLSTAAICAAILAAPGAQANQITGSIGFDGSGVTINSVILATATSFSISSPAVNTTTGVYNAVPSGDSNVTFNGFVFSPPVSSITPLWTFTVGTTVYSFDATTVSSTFNSALDSWEMGGAGIAMITGFDDTPGTWNVNLSETGDSFVFDSSAGSVASVPDGGSTLMMLGSALLVLGVSGRKFCC